MVIYQQMLQQRDETIFSLQDKIQQIESKLSSKGPRVASNPIRGVDDLEDLKDKLAEA